MQNLARWLENLAGAPGKGPGDTVNADVAPWRALYAKAGVTALGLIAACIVGAASLVVPNGLSLDLFYLATCAFVGWVAGTIPALLVALASGALVYLNLSESGTPAIGNWIDTWNLSMRVLGFAAIGWLASKFGTMTHSLERTVHERTGRLEKEIEQHKETADFLREALELFKQVTENITDVFWVTDATKREVEYVSPEFEKVWGETCQTLLDAPKTWLQRVHPEDQERLARATMTKQITGDYEEEYRVVRTDGAVRWVRDRAFPVKDEAGAVYRIVGIAEDITERKRTQYLLEAERDLGLALSSTSDLKFALERLLEVIMDLGGIDCGAVYLIRPETGDLHLETCQGMSEEFRQRSERYKADSNEMRLARAGKIVYLRRDEIPRELNVLWGGEGLRALALVPLQHKGMPLGMLNLASYHDEEISAETRVGIEVIASLVAGAIARIAAEDSLRRSEAHLRSIINSAPIALLATDREGTITFEDGRALSAMGVKPGEHARRSAMEVYREYPLLLDNFDRAMAGEEFESILEFGSNLLDCRYTPVREQDGRPGGFIAVATDVTERFRLQQQILEISDREQARIGQDVHDGLCQQLIGMALTANSLEKTLTTEARPESVAAQKICRLLDEAITESRRVCRGLYPVRLETEGLVAALEELAQTVSQRYKVGCDFETDTRHYQCDVTTATHLYRIAQEAVNNAIKHSGGHTIIIRFSGSGDEVELAIKDDGAGIKNRPARRAGMGLHIMDYRANRIGGTLKISTQDKGTIVTCRISRQGRQTQKTGTKGSEDRPH